MMQIAALAVREPVNESAGAVQELDATVDAVLDKGGALRLETGSPSQVLFVLNIDGSAEAAEERALVRVAVACWVSCDGCDCCGAAELSWCCWHGVLAQHG